MTAPVIWLLELTSTLVLGRLGADRLPLLTEGAMVVKHIDAEKVPVFWASAVPQKASVAAASR